MSELPYDIGKRVYRVSDGEEGTIVGVDISFGQIFFEVEFEGGATGRYYKSEIAPVRVAAKRVKEDGK